MSAQVVDYALAGDVAPAPGPVRMPGRPHLVLVPTGGAVSSGRRLRPTRVARLLVLSAVVGVLVAAACIVTVAWGSTAPAPHAVTVQAGQTLSGIAARELPALPVSEAVVRIQLANAMSASGVDAGQVLVIPAGG